MPEFRTRFNLSCQRSSNLCSASCGGAKLPSRAFTSPRETTPAAGIVATTYTISKPAAAHGTRRQAEVIGIGRLLPPFPDGIRRITNWRAAATL